MAGKNDLAKLVSSEIEGLSEEDAAYATRFIFDYLASELCKGNRIEIRGFGSFSARERKFAGREDLYKTVYYRMSRAVR